MGWWRLSRARRAARVAARLGELGHHADNHVGSGPRAEFRDGLRAELLRTHQEERAAAPKRPGPAHARPRIRRIPLLVRLRPWLTLGGMVAATVSMAALTYSTVPGELLYPLKRAAESTLLTLTTSDAERTDRQMTVARSRASEAAELLKAATPDSEELLGQTLEDMETTTRAALERVKQPTKPPAKVRRFARDQKKVVEKMVPKLDAENREIATQYLSLISGYAGVAAN
ncbi:DUF5667 domain-containing protein [Herbidospora mongoliensis]|uniref:DUF5667 domain-containing protein n=1 Tax=Herbidospora mongoliensis TaxID=688067 RepID=UPI00082AEB73|nr:DUF5667 domain-containing protein [Herbidospora mongoliensis]